MKTKTAAAITAATGLGLVGLAYFASRAQQGPTVAPQVGRQPFGKGLFVRTPRHAGSAQSFAQTLSGLGVSWVPIMVLWQHSDREVAPDLGMLSDYADAARAVGVDVWIWGWPRPSASARTRFAARFAEAVNVLDAVGSIVNAEKPFYGPYDREAAALLQALVVDLERRPLGFSSYGGGPPNHPGFPWGPFAEICDFGMPQIYDTRHNLGPDYPQRSIASWRLEGFQRLIPVWGASSAHTPDQMRDIIRRTPVPNQAACWWDLYHVTRSAARARVVQEYQPPRLAAA